ncbi:hypothetical protein MSG28_003852 [Choristoneura fumiferana]|uniref:Uncharacterized protein n=1 Tax=Choristoneura fumiferana TaxID=7141 RepID=A0ACC0KH56_CHOFU|nr:hypothetical protein MSG28_003852 [Choristoneura fumiferana]
MFQVTLVGAALIAVVLGGRSPHADLVDQFQNSPDGSRFSTDVFEDARLDIVIFSLRKATTSGSLTHEETPSPETIPPWTLIDEETPNSGCTAGTK